MNKTKYKNILITGASRGIGKALALEYASAGTSLVLLSRNAAELKKLSESINSRGGNSYFKECDVSKYGSVKEAVAFAREKLGSINLAILNAGTGKPDRMEEFTSSELISVFEVNTFGIAHFLEFLIPLMRSIGGGTIAGVSTLADIRGYPGSSPYSSSKAAASIILESARVELKKFNIKVITVRPGFVRTDMTAKNEFRMPFLMEPEKAARIIRKGIEKGRSVVNFPFFTSAISRITKLLPNWIYDPILRKLRPMKKK